MNPTVHSSTFRGLVSTAILGGALALSLGASAAGNRPKPVSGVVNFADLDIASRAGAAELYHRIHAAAVGVCSYYWFETDAAEARCTRDAISNAVVAVGAPALAAIYSAKYKVSPPAPRVVRSARSKVAGQP